jgi:hypothetical protein
MKSSYLLKPFFEDPPEDPPGENFNFKKQVGCNDVAMFRLVTIDSSALIQSCLLFTNLNYFLTPNLS